MYVADEEDEEDEGGPPPLISQAQYEQQFGPHGGHHPMPPHAAPFFPYPLHWPGAHLYTPQMPPPAAFGGPTGPTPPSQHASGFNPDALPKDMRGRDNRPFVLA
jgi:hypothetical protein